MVDDFGPDFDEEGNPLEEGESDRIKSEEERQPVPAAEAGAGRSRSGGRARGGGGGGAGAAAWIDMATRKEVKNRISSVKNVQKITRAMEMVAAARLRRAEQRIDALRPTPASCAR